MSMEAFQCVDVSREGDIEKSMLMFEQIFSLSGVKIKMSFLKLSEFSKVVK